MACRQDQRIPPLKYSNKTTRQRHHSYTTRTRRAIVPPHRTQHGFPVSAPCENNISIFSTFDPDFLYIHTFVSTLTSGNQLFTRQHCTTALLTYFLYTLLLLLVFLSQSTVNSIALSLYFNVPSLQSASGVANAKSKYVILKTETISQSSF